MRIKSLINSVFCLSVFAVITASVSSCKNSNDANASVQFVNTSPDAGTVNFYVSGNLKTSTPIAYGNSSGYFSATAGNQTGEVKSSASSAATLASTQLNLVRDSKYSVFVCGSTAAKSVGMIVMQDDLTTPSSGKAKVRFVNTVDNSPQVNLLSNSATLFSGISYKSTSSFTEVNAGNYNLTAVSTSVTAVTVAALSQTFVSGKIYTVYFKGQLGATSDPLKLSLSVMTNN